MLIQFKFKNFKSFRDEATLDLSAARMREFEERVVTIGGESILTVATIYGANASGKSNVYSAFRYMSDYVIRSFEFGDIKEEYVKILPRPFLFDTDSENADSSFEVYFTLPGDKSERIYNYGFCIGKDGITEEWLNYKAKTARKYKPIFYRDTQHIEFKGIPKISKDNIEVALEKQTLIVSLGAKLKIDNCKLIRDWFMNNELVDFGDEASNFYRSTRFPSDFVDDEKFRENLVKFLGIFDEDNIKGFKLTKMPVKKKQEENVDHYRIYSLHQKINSTEMGEIPFEQESAGTLKMFFLYPKFHEVLERGSVLFVDELNSRLHPLLVRNFVLFFLNPQINVNHAQLIFTAHDTWLMSNQLLRRDEIWFTEKDKDGLSTLYSLADFVDETGSHIRKDMRYEKNYLLGKYGAIPSLKTIDTLKEV